MPPPTASTPPACFPAADVADWLRLFLEPGQVTELRAIGVGGGKWPRTDAGYYDYDHLGEMARAAVQLSPDAVGVYFIPNPVDPDLLARRANRVDAAGKDDVTSDNHVLARRWLVVDADPIRVAGVSSTDAEKAEALGVVERARDVVLAARLATRLVVADSGNGYHLACRVDLPADDGDRCRLTLAALAAKLDTPRVKVDRKLFNPSRIIKLYGTLSRKGDHTPRRPHRASKVIEVIDP